MRFAGRESWQVSHGTNVAVNTALFLRDTLALSVDTVPELPGLSPSVPVFVPPGVNRAAISEEWLGWWADIIDFARAEMPRERQEVPVDSESTSLRTRPAIRAAVLALRERTAAYDRDRGVRSAPGSLPVGEVVRGVEAALGRPVRPFRLVITEVAVQGAVWERMTPTHVIASDDFLADPSRSARALQAAVEDLA
jgi:hypothetical protein